MFSGILIFTAGGWKSWSPRWPARGGMPAACRTVATAGWAAGVGCLTGLARRARENSHDEYWKQKIQKFKNPHFLKLINQQKPILGTPNIRKSKIWELVVPSDAVATEEAMFPNFGCLDDWNFGFRNLGILGIGPFRLFIFLLNITNNPQKPNSKHPKSQKLPKPTNPMIFVCVCFVYALPTPPTTTHSPTTTTVFFLYVFFCFLFFIHLFFVFVFLAR